MSALLMSQTGRATARATSSSEELVTRARGGDEEAFRLIFNRYARPIISFIYDMVGRRDLAEELAQETFVRAFRSLHSMREDTKLSTWLFGIAKNVARESLRARRRDEREVGIDDDAVANLGDGLVPPDGALLNKELNGVIQNALEKLDEDKRLVFTLRVFQQRSYDEIAQITGFSVPKVKTDLHRARTEMRDRIRTYLGVSK